MKRSTVGLIGKFFVSALFVITDARGSKFDLEDCASLAGQVLVVPAPVDLPNGGSKKSYEYFKRVKPGALFMGASLYPQMGRTADDSGMVATYHEGLRSAAHNAGVFPVFLFADFELPVEKGGLPLENPISMMSLATTKDPLLVYKHMRLVGLRLKKLGIDGIFGPVLDVDTVRGKRPANQVGNRVASDDPEIVGSIGYAYAQGIRDSGLLAFAKHLPGYGSVSGSSEAYRVTLPYTNISGDEFGRHLQPFIKTSNIVDGYMTSHLTYMHLDDANPLTVSAQAISRVLDDLGARVPKGGRVLVSDDISNMGGAAHILTRKEIILQERSFGGLAAQALIAGHDWILIASHSPGGKIADVLKKTGIYVGSKIAEDVAAYIENRCNRSPGFKSILQDRAGRIVQLKNDYVNSGKVPYISSGGRYYYSGERYRGYLRQVEKELSGLGAIESSVMAEKATVFGFGRCVGGRSCFDQLADSSSRMVVMKSTAASQRNALSTAAGYLGVSGIVEHDLADAKRFLICALPQ